jgi:chorismate mutase/prephenate dehydrogenase
MTDPLLELRHALNAVDQQIVQQLAERQRLVQQIGTLKRAEGRPLRDFRREKEVLDQVRAIAADAGLEPDVAESVLRILIRASLEHQEHAQVSASASGRGKRALVIGGAGKMGRWFAEFLETQGFEVEIADPAGPIAGFAWKASWKEPNEGPPLHDVVVVSAPIAVTAKILSELAELRPPGLIFDLGSIKSPLRAGLQALADAGCRVTSIHPMFGPDTSLLSGRHILLCPVSTSSSGPTSDDTGVGASTISEVLHRIPSPADEARALFDSTSARLIEVSLEAHDRLVAYVLGLSHALNIAFFTALSRSGEAAPVLAGLSSTTFDAQLDIATRVANENPSLYFEIQHLNDAGLGALQALEESVSLVTRAVREGDEAAFTALMMEGRAYLSTRQPHPGEIPSASGANASDGDAQ